MKGYGALDNIWGKNELFWKDFWDKAHIWFLYLIEWKLGILMVILWLKSLMNSVLICVMLWLSLSYMLHWITILLRPYTWLNMHDENNFKLCKTFNLHLSYQLNLYLVKPFIQNRSFVFSFPMYEMDKEKYNFLIILMLIMI